MLNAINNIISAFEEKGLSLKYTNNSFRGTCPFRDKHDSNADGSNSFFLNPQINGYHCFSCGAHGNASQLLLKVIEARYSDVIEVISFGLSTGTHSSSGITSPVPTIDKIFDFSTPPERYLARGLTAETLRHFKIGSRKGKKGDAVIIPYFVEDNPFPVAIKEVYYTAEDKRDYANVAEGVIPEGYLYNYNPDNKEAILVEGESDVWNLYQHGYKNAEAITTSSASPEQIKFLCMHDIIYIMMDNDWAGIKGIEQIYSKLKYKPIKILVVPYSSDDPGTCKKRELIRAFKNSVSYVEYSVTMSLLHGEEYLSLKDKYHN